MYNDMKAPYINIVVLLLLLCVEKGPGEKLHAKIKITDNL